MRRLVWIPSSARTCSSCTCVGSTPFRGAGKSLPSGQYGSCTCNTAKQCRCQTQSSWWTTSALVLSHDGPPSGQELHPQVSPLSGVGDGSHLLVSAGGAFPTLYTVTRVSVLLLLPSASPRPWRHLALATWGDSGQII